MTTRIMTTSASGRVPPNAFGRTPPGAIQYQSDFDAQLILSPTPTWRVSARRCAAERTLNLHKSR
jgi:hypothetical protein